MANTSWKTIAAEVVRLIEAGELPVGARLPSGDDLATQWGVSRHTAHRAIDELQRAGLGGFLRVEDAGDEVTGSHQPEAEGDAGMAGFGADGLLPRRRPSYMEDGGYADEPTTIKVSGGDPKAVKVKFMADGGQPSWKQRGQAMGEPFGGASPYRAMGVHPARVAEMFSADGAMVPPGMPPAMFVCSKVLAPKVS